jgi:L-aminopeptidase/D-esterase-like protein
MALTKLKNLITDVPGITVGNAADHTRMTGVSVVLPDRPAVAAVDVRGGAPGTRETDLLTPSCMVDRIDAVCLSGGSVFGLQAADAVVDWLAARHRGFAVGPWHMPIVPAAIIFDLMIGEVEQSDGGRPYRALAEQACDAAGAAFSLGNAGAGMGARAGKLKGGLGSASAASEDGMIVGALAVANPVGAVTMPGTDTFWAWALERNGELGHQSPPATAPEYADGIPAEARIGSNTTLAVVATNVALDKAQAQRVAIMAHDGFARAIRPVHTPFDGDTAFVLSTGERATGDAPAMTVARVGAMAADCVARAIARGVYEAEGVDGAPGYRESRKPAVG